MKLAIFKTTISRSKLQEGIFESDKEEIVGYEEMDEKEYWRPMAQYLYKILDQKGVIR